MAAAGRAEVISNFVGQAYQGNASFDYAAAEKQLIPVAALTPFIGTRNWFVKVRVLKKEDVKRWTNAKGTGLVTSMVVVDDKGTAVRASFHKEGVDKFYNLLREGDVFYLGRGSVRAANKKYSSLPHDYELSFDGDSIVQPVRAEDEAAKTIARSTTSNFISIGELPLRQAGAAVDIRAVVSNCSLVTEVTQKSTGRQLKRRTVQLADSSGAAVELVLWEDNARACDAKPGDAVVVRNVRVAVYQGTVSVSASSIAEIDWHAAGPDAVALQKWWETTGKDSKLNNISQRSADGEEGKLATGSHRTGLTAVEEENLGRGEKPDFINIRGVVVDLREDNLWYHACGSLVDGKPCNKKLDGFKDGVTTHCPKCNRDVDKSVPRYIAGMRVADHTTDVWVTLFDDVATDFFGLPAKALKEDEGRVQTLKHSLFMEPVLLTLRVKEDVTPQGESRMKYVVHRGRLLRSARDWDIECRNISRDLERYKEMEDAKVRAP